MRCTQCGSFAFNLHRRGIDQGELCDAHYFESKFDDLRNAMMLPHISSDEDGNITLEWWYKSRKITMYPHADILLKVWGPNMETEMSEIRLSDNAAARDAFKWLAED